MRKERPLSSTCTTKENFKFIIMSCGVVVNMRTFRDDNNLTETISC